MPGQTRALLGTPIERRRMLQVAGSTFGLWAGSASAATGTLRGIDLNQTLRDEEADSVLGRFRIDQSEAAPSTDLRTFSAEPGIENWTTLPEDKRKAMPVAWNTDQATSADRAFVPPLPSLEPFAVRPATLAAWASNNAMPVPPLVLFGIRGAKLQAESADWTESVEITPAEPDHIHNRCVMGVWDVTAGRLIAYTGSTVPNVNWMYQQTKAEPNSCNMIPTGQYLYRSGPHGKYPGCFRLNDTVFTRRTYDRLTYRITSWGRDVSNPATNIHLGFFDQSRDPAYFSSAGCQTVRGGWSGTDWAYARSFAAFRVAAGQPRAIPSGRVALATDNRPYVYCLIDSADLMLTAAGKGITTRRQGSTGDDIPRFRQAMAEKLGAPVPPSAGKRFDGRLGQLVVQWQSQSGRPTTGILSTEDAQALGVPMAAGKSR